MAMHRVGEYIWDGKYDPDGKRRSVDPADVRVDPHALETVGVDDARSRLMRGDALGACAGLLRDGVNVQCCYIDPPFDVGHSFSMTADGPVAYGDRWGVDARSYIHVMYERCAMIRGILAEDGCLLVHCDWRVSHRLRMMLDELFGERNFRNEIVWAYRSGGASRRKSLPRKHDSILLYSKSEAFFIRPLTERQYLRKPFMGSKVDADGRHYVDTLLRDVIEGAPTVLDEAGRPEEINCRPVLNVSADRLGYPTQKPRGLLELLIRATTDPGDLVADLFCGSGTTLEAAARTGRDFVGADIGGHAFRTTRARLLRCGASFTILDLGVTRRADQPSKSDDEVLQSFGANKDAHGVWRRDGERCEIGVDGIRSVMHARETDATVLFDRMTPEIAGMIEEALSAGVRIRPVMVPRELHDPCECEELRWVGLTSFVVDCDNRDGELTITLRDAKVDGHSKAPVDFIDSWAVDPSWDGVGTMRPMWRSARDAKTGKLCVEARIRRCGTGGSVGVIVVDLHGNVHRMRTLERAVHERSVPIIQA